MKYDNMTKNINDLNAEMKRKREAENTALDGYDANLSGLEFTVGESDLSFKNLYPALGIAAVISMRILLKDHFRGGDGLGTVGIVCIALLAVIIIASAVFQKNKSKIIIRGKELIYKGNTWADYQISHVVLPDFGNIKIYSGGKVIAKAGYTEENSELLIAWFKRCRIMLEDNRREL